MLLTLSFKKFLSCLFITFSFAVPVPYPNYIWSYYYLGFSSSIIIKPFTCRSSTTLLFHLISGYPLFLFPLTMSLLLTQFLSSIQCRTLLYSDLNSFSSLPQLCLFPCGPIGSHSESKEMLEFKSVFFGQCLLCYRILQAYFVNNWHQGEESEVISIFLSISII